MFLLNIDEFVTEYVTAVNNIISTISPVIRSNLLKGCMMTKPSLVETDIIQSICSGAMKRIAMIEDKLITVTDDKEIQRLETEIGLLRLVVNPL